MEKVYKLSIEDLRNRSIKDIYVEYSEFIKDTDTIIIDYCNSKLPPNKAEITFYQKICKYAVSKKKKFQLININNETLNLILEGLKEKKEEKQSILHIIGEKIINISLSFYDFIEINLVVLQKAFQVLFLKKRYKKGEFINNMVLIGLNAFPIIALVALLFGIVLTLQSALQLRQFGANIFVVDLIGISLTREMGPLITAIIIAGRSSSSIAAEIGTMKIMEEIDALKVMGLHPIEFVVVPKFYAMIISLPLLTIMTNFIGIIGGFITSALTLDLTSSIFFNRLFSVLVFKDIFTGLIKSIFFAYLIMVIATFYGFKVKSGAEDVGIYTTSSVVAATFWVIVADAFFSIFFYYG